MIPLWELADAEGNLLGWSDVSGLRVGGDAADTPVLCVEFGDRKLLVEAPGHRIASGVPADGARQAVLCLEVERLQPAGTQLRCLGGEGYIAASSAVSGAADGQDGAALLRLQGISSPPRGSLLAELPGDFTCDEAGLSALLATGRQDLEPVVEAMLEQLTALQVRNAWARTEATTKSCFMPLIREHGRTHLGRFARYTVEIMQDQIARFGWSIGDKTYGAPLIFEASLGKLTIGRYCSLADPAIILGNHSTRTASSYPFLNLWIEWPSTSMGAGLSDHVSKDVVIGNDVWIGHQSIILPGARIGDGAVIAAGSVVSGVVPPYAIVSGNPGRVRGQRFGDRTVGRLLELRWWDWPESLVDRFIPYLLTNDIASFLEAAEADPAVKSLKRDHVDTLAG